MSLDYFDDEFMEGIPSIAPDLMFVEEDNPTTTPVEHNLRKENEQKEEKVRQEDLPTSVFSEEPDLETTIEVDSPKISKEIELSIDDEEPIVKQEEKEHPVVLSQEEKEHLLSLIIDDHSYARPFPEMVLKKENEGSNMYLSTSSILKLHPRDLPPKKKYKKKGSKSKMIMNEDDVDVVTVDKPDELLVKYDGSRGRHVMNEVEAYLNSLWKDVEKDDEEKISRGSWSKEQARFFDAVYGVINNYQLAKLAYNQVQNEPVLRKLALEKATSRIRKAFGSVVWNSKLVVWLHGVMIDGLSSSLFLCYLEILQALKRKVPSLFERIFLNDKTALEKEQTAGLSFLGARLKKSWEPAVGLNTKVTMEKFPISPFLITIPCGPSVPHQSTKRNRFWNYQLMNIGKAVPISVPAYRTPEGYVVKHYLEHCISAVRSKTSEFSTRFPERPIVLIGWNVGSLIAMKVALLDKVQALVCLGFPYNHIKGDDSEDYWDAFTKIECPVLFVLGTHALSNSIDKIDSLRQKMKVHTNLIIMESGDELLRLTKSQKRSLGMTQNMIDRLIQDQLYIFLRDVLFKARNVYPMLTESASPRKKKKKVNDTNTNDMLKDESNKKKKKSKQFQLINTNNDSYSFSPLDVSVGLQGEKGENQTSEGLLTTGSISISTPIPVTHMQSESIMAPTSMSHLTVSTESTSSPTVIHKAGQKRSSTNKEKTVRKKVAKKTPKFPQNFTASLGNQRAGNLFGQRFTTPIANRPAGSQQQQTATLQRLPSGTFVLSGTSGHVKLQNGNNIVYLQQLTSSGGTTQVIQTPLIANSNGTFSTVPIASSGLPTVVRTTTQTLVQSKLITTTTTTSSVMQQSKQTSPNQQQQQQQHQQLPSEEPDVVEQNTPNTPTSGQSSDISPTIPVSLANLILSLPSTSTSGSSLEVSAQTQNVLQKLSENDIKILASVLGKYSPATPASPASISPARTPDSEKSPLQSPSSSLLSPKSTDNPSIPPGVNEQKISTSHILSMFDQKSTSSTAQPKKISYPLSLTQKVAAIQQGVNKMRAPRLKPPRIITTGITSNKTSSSTVTSINKTLQSKTQKVPITITIPISRLPSSLQLTTSSSKTINVPALSAYLAQQKFVLSTGKSPNLDSRTVLLNPSHVKKIGGSIMVSTNSSSKTPSVFTPNKTSQKHGATGKSSATITLHLPTQAAQKESLKKAASDIKLIGVLNQKTKAGQLISVPSYKSSSLPGSPILSPTPSTEELSPVQPRKPDDSQTVPPSDAPMEEVKSLNKSEGNDDLIDESDIDFSVHPSSGPTTIVPQQNVSSAVMTQSAIPLQKHFVTTSKIIRVPVSTSERTSFSNKNLLELAKAKLSENQLMNSARKVGVAFQQKSAETKSLETKDADSPVLLEGNKLRFEPLNTPSTRPNLSSVLSSMREAGKIVLDEHGQLRNTIVAKPTVVTSKTAAMIARTAFMTDTKLGAKPLSFSALNSKPNTSSRTITPALFSSGTSNTSVISTPAATIRTATTSKVLPVTIKSNDFIRMSTQVRVQPQSNVLKQALPKVIKKDASKSETKSRAKKAAIVETKPEPKEEPPPYVTRSGRVLRTRFSFSDELDRKSPRKKRRTNSASKDETSAPQQPPVTPTTTPLGGIGSSLDSLVEAAKLITTSDHSDGNDPVSTDNTIKASEIDVSSIHEPASSLKNVDSTTNIAATAMLELLSGNVKSIIPAVESSITMPIDQLEQHEASKISTYPEPNEELNFSCDIKEVTSSQTDSANIRFVDDDAVTTTSIAPDNVIQKLESPLKQGAQEFYAKCETPAVFTPAVDEKEDTITEGKEQIALDPVQGEE